MYSIQYLNASTSTGFLRYNAIFIVSPFYSHIYMKKHGLHSHPSNIQQPVESHIKFSPQTLLNIIILLSNSSFSLLRYLFKMDASGSVMTCELSHTTNPLGLVLLFGLTSVTHLPRIKIVSGCEQLLYVCNVHFFLNKFQCIRVFIESLPSYT